MRSLLLSIFALMARGGFMPTLVSVRLEGAGAGAPLIGLVGSAYFAGLALGSLQAAKVIRRVGHIRAFAFFVSLLSASTLVYVLHQAAWLWAGLRLIDGFCLAGVYVCVESWLNDRADPLPKDWPERLSTTRLLHLVEVACGIEALRVLQVASAVAAGPAAAARLEVPVGSPLLSLRRTYFDRDGVAIEFSRILGRPDRCEQSVELFRVGG